MREKCYQPCFSVVLLIILTGCSDPQVDLRCLTGKYSNSELGYFKQSGFFDYKSVKRWKKSVTIGFAGDLTKEDNKNIDSLVVEMQPLLDSIKLVKVNGHGDITFFVTETFKGKEIKKMGLGFTRTYPSRSNPDEIEKADIWIYPGLTELERRKTMQHEFMHALGLEHPAGYKGTILGKKVHKSLDDYIQSSEKYKKISGLDEALVRILYDPCIPDGLTIGQFDKLTKSLSL